MFYNFLHGWSDSLSLPVVERFAKLFPNSGAEILLHPVSAMIGRSCSVTMLASEGLLQPTACLPLEEQERLVVAQGFAASDEPLFGVRVDQSFLYPRGTLLVCRSLEPGNRPADQGHVIVRVGQDGGVEVTVRQLDRSGPSNPWFWLRNSGTEFHCPLPVSLADPRDPDDHVIEGLVLASWQPAPRS